MKKIKSLLALAIAGVITSGCNTITEVGSINGVNIATHTKIGLFSPSTTTSYSYDPAVPGVIHRENTAANAGTLGQVAGAGGQVGAAPLIRPSRTSVNNSSNNESSNVGHDVATGSVTVNNLPPAVNVNGHPNSPGNGGQPGNGGVNNPNQ